jgi:hypothetical protein
MAPIRILPRPAPVLDPGLTVRSDLRSMVVHMINTNSLAAFTAEVSRLQGPAQARGTAPSAQASTGASAQPQPAQRKLEALPSAPNSNLPRGSLLDLRV